MTTKTEEATNYFVEESATPVVVEETKDEGSDTKAMLAAALERITSLEAQVAQQRTLPIARPLEEAVTDARQERAARLKVGRAATGEVATTRKVTDLANPRSQAQGLQPGDVVGLKEDSDKFQALNAYANKNNREVPEGGILGRVGSYMLTRGNGVRKYKVQWGDGFGKDGVDENDLELVKRA